MNLLAHAYLSFRQPELLVGNMISDFVKGRKRFDFPDGIQKGIALHRAIDTFTDEHPVNIEAKKIFKPAVGLYGAAFLDVAYDHFLAADNLAFPSGSLPDFTQWVYKTIGGYEHHFPASFAGMYPYMKEQDWLSNYQFRWGIEKSMQGLVRRARYLEDAKPAFDAFESNIDQLQNAYHRFFPELLLFVTNYYRNHLIGSSGTTS